MRFEKNISKKAIKRVLNVNCNKNVDLRMISKRPPQFGQSLRALQYSVSLEARAGKYSPSIGKFTKDGTLVSWAFRLENQWRFYQFE